MSSRLAAVVSEDRIVVQALMNCIAPSLLVTVSTNYAEFFSGLKKRTPELIIAVSEGKPDGFVMTAIEQVRRQHRNIPVILVAARSSEELAIAALKAGAKDYVKYPFSPADIHRSIHLCLSGSIRAASDRAIGAPSEDLVGGERMIGRSSAVQKVKEYIKKVAAADCTVLVTGETGTGKELVAELVHRNSPRKPKPFVCVNCAAIPDGLLESELFGYERGAFTGADISWAGRLKSAEGGTVFFDEVGDLSPVSQAKILRAIEARQIQRLRGRETVPIDIRIVAATNQDLDLLVKNGTFRSDLFFRLNVARVHLPPLRQRKTDIPFLLDYYFQDFNRGKGGFVTKVREDVLQLLISYEWPGNIRELRNLVESILINAPQGEIGMKDLPEQFCERISGTPCERDPDRLLSALLSTNWNKSKAAERLRWSRMKVYRTIAKYSLAIPGRR
jgi:DNA-binding NtrC family response regulator